MKYFILILCLLFNGCDNSPTDGGDENSTTGGDDGTTTGGEEDAPLVEDYFAFNISNKYSFYWFEEVLINFEKIDSDDWVAAFKGDVCVGAQQWTCPGNCNLPVYGVNELNDLTQDYMLPGELPSFKIYDASEHIYYDAVPSQEFEWADGQHQNQFQADSLYYRDD